MIARIWHGRTEAAKADAYFEFLKERAVHYPEDADFLLEFEPTVEHYELYVAPDNKSE